jgi:hypothetical protein
MTTEATTPSQAPINDERLYTINESKQYIPVSDVTFWRWEKKGLVQFVKIGTSKFLPGSTLRRLVTEGAGGAA